MSGPAFTPGPWSVVQSRLPSGKTCLLDRHGIAIAHTVDRADDEQANARLIAAAPELYAAVQALLSADIVDATSEALEQANAALRKARGETA